ncbi:MAG: altronate dehydratase family protein [Lachnospiraceae bacterium]|nr:altronate dehydratase family protein [Lachnospiraceae bacterium]
MKYIQIHPNDNVAVMLEDIARGEKVSVEGGEVISGEPIMRGHKIALRDISEGDPVIKYGNVIAVATKDVKAGEWVHTHNVRTNLSESDTYLYEHIESRLPEIAERTFQGYLRQDGRAAIRNELWIIPTVGCVNSVAGELAKQNQHLVTGSVEGLYSFPHPFGCSQLGEDHEQTKKLLAELVEYAGAFQREEISASKLVIGMKCGGSDGLSGITANPTVGRFSDYLVSIGGSTVLTEVPEMFGAERILFNRCQNKEVFDKAVAMVNDFKAYFVEHGQVVYENPSPGNKAGGITTLEDKSCGCVQKGGQAQIVDVLRYAEPVVKRGLNLLSGPGNDLVSATNLTAAGAHMILFTTGRGTPFGAPAPTVKISTNTALAEKKSEWIDFNAGTVAEGEPLNDAGLRPLDYVLSVAGGEKTQTEKRGYREISIFKDGVVL